PAEQADKPAWTRARSAIAFELPPSLGVRPVLPAPYTHFGPAARCSAGFQPAVSQGFQPAGLSKLPTRPEPSPGLPIGNRRPAPKAFGVHRLETCATSAHEMRARCRRLRRSHKTLFPLPDSV